MPGSLISVKVSRAGEFMSSVLFMGLVLRFSSAKKCIRPWRITS